MAGAIIGNQTESRWSKVQWGLGDLGAGTGSDDEEAGRREHGNLERAVRGAIWPEGPHLYKKKTAIIICCMQKEEPDRNTASVWREAESCFNGLRDARAIRSLHIGILGRIILWSMLVMGIWWRIKTELVCGDARHETL